MSSESAAPAPPVEAAIGDTGPGVPPGASRAGALRLGTAWAVLLTCVWLGVAFSPWLLVNAPLLLLAMSPLPRHLLFAVPKVELGPFLVIATLRTTLPQVLWYFMGVVYGERGIRWFEGRYVRLGRAVRAIERMFRRASLPLLVIWPNPLFSLLAGAWGMRMAVFLPLTLLGQALWMVGYYWVGAAIAEFTAPITAWIETHMVELTLGCVVLVGAGQGLRQLRRRRLGAS